MASLLNADSCCRIKLRHLGRSPRGEAIADRAASRLADEWDASPELSKQGHAYPSLQGFVVTRIHGSLDTKDRDSIGRRPGHLG